MTKIHYIDRSLSLQKIEKVYGSFFIKMLYQDTPLSRAFSFFLLPFVAYFSFFSKLYGMIQKSRFSRFKIRPFIQKYHINTEEFQDPVSSFKSFNDFFIRKLKPHARPVDSCPNTATFPADGKYLAFSSISQLTNFFVKGKLFSLASLLQDIDLAKQYEKGSLLIARLCPTDYHRFHFPCDGLLSLERPITGTLYSVNPLATRRRPSIFVENKRCLSIINSPQFDQIIYIEVGATNVGSIHHTAKVGSFYQKGEEKGYFSFGGSCLILLFKPQTIRFEKDLLLASQQGLELAGLMGQKLGTVY